MDAIFRINDIMDLPVIDNITHQKLCTIRDIIIDLRENRVYAFICGIKLFNRSSEAVLFESVESISQNYVTIAGRSSIISYKEQKIEKGRYKSCQGILGKPVTNIRGEVSGVIRDILISEKSGIVEAYELSEGYIDDFLKGRHIIRTDDGSLSHGNSDYALYHK